MHDALSASLGSGEANSAVTATLIKFVGKGFGSIACANSIARTDMWTAPRPMPAAGGRPIVDASVRFEDALAAAVKIKLHIVNQLWAELVIAKSKAQAATRQSSEWAESQFDSITNACRRFLDYAAAKTADDAAILPAGLTYALQRASRRTVTRVCIYNRRACGAKIW